MPLKEKYFCSTIKYILFYNSSSTAFYLNHDYCLSFCFFLEFLLPFSLSRRIMCFILIMSSLSIFVVIVNISVVIVKKKHWLIQSYKALKALEAWMVPETYREEPNCLASGKRLERQLSCRQKCWKKALLLC